MNIFKTFMAGLFVILLSISSAFALNSDCYNKIITVYNQSSYDVIELYVSCRDCDTWSHDYLGDQILPPGYSITIDGDWAPGSAVGYHVYDLLALGPNGIEWSIRMDMCTQSSWTLVN